jgi:SAM-dependent methyltransferase
LLDRATALAPVARLRERVMARRGWELKETPDGLPLPPAALRVLVTETADPTLFLLGGAASAEVICNGLDDAGVELAGTVLDFGCGCGRVARQWAGLGLDLHGCDYNPKLAKWCSQNLPFMRTRVNSLTPPSAYEPGTFDLVYAMSILTHLTEPVAHAWVAEWERILKPGGVLLISVHGDAFRDQLGRQARPLYDAGEMVVKKARIEGMNACVANHPYAYVTERLLARFDLLSFTPNPSEAFAQDVYVARARNSS